MKIARFLIALCLVSGFAVHAARPQAVVLKGETFYWGSYETTQSQVVMSSSGNFLIKVTFQLNPDDERIPLKGSYKMPATALFFYNELYELEGEMIFTPDGKAIAIFHLKG